MITVVELKQKQKSTGTRIIPLLLLTQPPAAVVVLLVSMHYCPSVRLGEITIAVEFAVLLHFTAHGVIISGVVAVGYPCQEEGKLRTL